MKRRERIQFCFRNEVIIALRITESKLDSGAPKSMGHGSGISKPTEVKAIRNMMPVYSVTVLGEDLRRPEDWIRLVRRTKAKFNNNNLGKIYHVEYQINLSWKERNIMRKGLMKELKVTRHKYYALRSRIVDYAEKIAKEMGLD